MPQLDPARESRFILSRDGLRLHYLEYGPPESAPTPVVCLPGLARSSEDFDRLARALAADGRRVLALDYRGRGLSDRDPNWKNYCLDVEETDILAVLLAAEVGRAIFVGTSRGGIHTMRLGASRPDLVRAAVINDIGPQIELAGLLRIKGYVGKLPPIASMPIAVTALKLTAGPQFPAVSQEEWDVFARATFEEKDGKLEPRYDPELAHTFDNVGPDSEPILFAEEWAAMTSIPTLGIRGSNSDLLSAETFERMKDGHPLFEALTVQGQGHAPLLLDAPTIAAIVDFVGRHSLPGRA